MGNRGTYNVSESGSNHSSFKSFICALLVFLALCLILYCIILLVKLSKGPAKEGEIPAKHDDDETYDRLTGMNNRPDKGKEDGRYSTHGPITTDSDLSEQTTHIRHSHKDKEKYQEKTEYYKEVEIATVQIRDETIVTTTNLPIDSDVPYVTTKWSRKDKEKYQEEKVNYREAEIATIRDETIVTTTNLPIDRDVSDITTKWSSGGKGGIDSATTNNIGEETSTATATWYLPDRIDKSDTTTKLSSGGKGGIDSATTNNIGEETITATATWYLPDRIDKSDTTTKLSNTLEDTSTEFAMRDVSTTEDFNIDLGVNHSLFYDTSSEDTNNAVGDERKTTDIFQSSSYSVDSTESVSVDSVGATTDDSRSTDLNSYGTSMNRDEILTTEHFHLTSKSSGAMLELNEGETPAKFTDAFETSTEINLPGSSTTESYIYTTAIETGLPNNPAVSVSDPASFESTTDSAVGVTFNREINVTVKDSALLSTTNTPEDKGTTESYSHNTGRMALTSQNNAEKLCQTAVCHRASSKMLNLMNHAADPCVDFYEFACGGQESDNDFARQSNLETLLNYFTEVDRKFLEDFKFFYESCVNYEHEFKFAERIKLMEYFPKNNLTDLFVDLILTQSMPLFDVGLEIAKESQHYTLQITLPGKSSLRANVDGWSIKEQIRKECLSEQSYLTRSSDVNLREVYESFKSCQKMRFKNTAKNFVDDMKPFFKNYKNSIYNDVNLKKLLKLLDDVQDSLPSELDIQTERLNKNYKPWKISDLRDAYNRVDWEIILESLTFNSTFGDSYYVNVYFTEHIQRVLDMLYKFKDTELMEILELYSKLQLYENIVIPKEKENREMYCMELSKQIMPDVVSNKVYDVARRDIKFHMQNRKLKELFDSLSNQFNKSLEQSTLYAPLKEHLQDKLQQINLGLITTVDYKSTEDNYREIRISKNDFQNNVLELLRNYRRVIYSLERTKASAASLLTYFVDPFDTRPRSFYLSKYIVVHPTIFQTTSMDLPDYIILSKVSLQLSRELARHFDPIGVQHMMLQVDYFGTYDYLTKQTTDSLLFYANNTYDVDGKSLNFEMNVSDLWTNQMIADNTAFRLVVDLLYQNQINLENLPWIYKSYSVEKVFFIAAVQEYCKKTTPLNFMEDVYQTGRLPLRLKVQNMISNSQKFSETFECVDGSAMKLTEELITQFPYINYDPEDDNYADMGNN